MLSLLNNSLTHLLSPLASFLPHQRRCFHTSRKSREHFRRRYESAIAAIPDSCFCYTPESRVDIARTVENAKRHLSAVDHFKFCVAAGFGDLSLGDLSEAEIREVRKIDFFFAYAVDLCLHDAPPSPPPLDALFEYLIEKQWWPAFAQMTSSILPVAQQSHILCLWFLDAYKCSDLTKQEDLFEVVFELNKQRSFGYQKSAIDVDELDVNLVRAMAMEFEGVPTKIPDGCAVPEAMDHIAKVMRRVASLL